MKILETTSMFERETSNLKVLPANRLNLAGYGDLAFECGCKEAHSVSGEDGALPQFTALPVKVLYKCPNGYLTFVHIKGIFSQKAVSLWSCKEDVAEG